MFASPTAVAAQEAGSLYSTDLPQFAHLRALEDRATDLQQNGAQDAAGRAAIIAAWRDLQIAAQRTTMPDGSVHPLAQVVRIKIASQLYADGQIDEALAEVEPGLEATRPYLDEYPAAMAEGAALLGVLLTHKGEPERALGLVEPLYADFVELAAREDKEGLAVAKSNLEFSLSQINLRLGQTAEALRYQKASLDTREAAFGPNHPDTVAGYYGYAQTLRRAGQMEEAERFARIAVERATGHVDPSHPSYARSLEMLGIVLANSGRPIEATEFLTSALELKREYEGADTLVLGYGIHNLGTILLQRERYEEVQPLFIEAEALMSRYQGPASAFPILALAYNGQASLALGDPAQAVRLLDEGRQRMGDDTQDVEALGRLLPDLIRAHLLLGDPASALARAELLEERVLASDTTDTLEVAFATLLRAHSQVVAGAGRAEERKLAARNLIEAVRHPGRFDRASGLEVRHLSALDLVMDIATEHDDAELMLAAMSLVSRSHLSRAQAIRTERLAASDPGLADLLRALREAEDAVDEADRALLLALARGESADPLRESLATARAQAAAYRDQLAARYPGWDRALEQTPSIAALQASLADGEAILSFAPIYYGTYALLVTPDTAVALDLSASRKSVIDLANSLGASVRVGGFDGPASRGLGASLFPEPVMERLAKTRALKLHTGGPLASLPFSLLQGWGGGADTAFLHDRFALSYLSDLSVEGASPTLPGERDAPLSLVAFAAPAPFGAAGASEDAVPQRSPSRISDYFDRAAANADALASLPALPGTADEVRAIAASISWDTATLFLAEDASEANFRSAQASEADVLVIATHGIVAGEVEGIAESALVLSPGAPGGDDGLLTAGEIARLRLVADWIILSSCDSAAGMSGGLPAFSGLAQAFRQAGGKDLLVTHWKVRDDIAAYVSTQAVLNYRSGMTKAEALRAAIDSLRKESGITGADEPFAWAPFVLIEG